jgi:RNA polymerase sigma factor (sigma-70 family)
MTPSGGASLESLLENAGWMRRLARRLASDEGEAEDLLQDTWLAALQRWPGGEAPPGWMARVLRNLASKAERSRRHRRAREASAARPEAQASDSYERARLQRELANAVLDLGEPYASTLILRYFEGLPRRAIARRQGVAVSTVKTRLARGIDLLRERLDRDHGGREAWLTALLPVLSPPSASPPAGLLINAQGGLLVAAVIAAGLLLCFVAVSLPRENMAEAVGPAASRQAERFGSRSTREMQPLLAVRTQVPRDMGPPPLEAATLGPSSKFPEGWRLLWDTSATPMLDVGPRGLAIGPRHELFVVDYGARSIRVYDKSRPEVARTREIDHFSGLAYSAGQLFAVQPRGGLSVFDVWTLEPIGKAKVEDPGGHWLVNSLCVDSRGHVHVLSSADGIVHVFDPSARALGTWNAGPNAKRLCAAPAGLILVASYHKQVTTIEFLSVERPDEPPRHLAIAGEFAYPIADMCVTKQRLYVATEDEGVFVYEFGGITEDPSTRSLVAWLPPGAGLSRIGHSSVTHIAVNPDERRVYLAYGHPDGIVVALELENVTSTESTWIDKQGKLIFNRPGGK